MAYLVNVTTRAQRDLLQIYEQIKGEDSAAAFEWYRGLTEAILGLKQHPNRCPATPENHKLGHLLCGHKPHIYRAIFRVLETQKQVEVLHIRHGARQRFQGADLESMRIAKTG